MISFLSSFNVKYTNISFFINNSISSLSGFTIESFKTSDVSLSKSIWAFFITYEFSLLNNMSLKVNLETERNLPWPWSPLTIISIVDIEILSVLVEYSWQYKLSSDEDKSLKIGFVQKCIFLRSDIKSHIVEGHDFVPIHQYNILEQLTCYQRNLINISIQFFDFFNIWS